MKKLLIHLEADVQASTFDQITAYDAGVDHVLAYGTGFQELFQRTGNFYDIDPLLFSPAQVYFSNRQSGRTFCAGRIRSDLLIKSFRIER